MSKYQTLTDEEFIRELEFWVNNDGDPLYVECLARLQNITSQTDVAQRLENAYEDGYAEGHEAGYQAGWESCEDEHDR
jgi:hypothetical protein